MAADRSPSAQLFDAPSPDEFADTLVQLTKVRDGEDSAFAPLCERFRPGLEMLVQGEVRRRAKTPVGAKLASEADDLLQEALNKGHSRIAQFNYRGPGSMLAWLLEILRNEIINRAEYWNAHCRSPQREQPHNTEMRGAIPVQDPGPGTQFGMSEGRARVAEALANLDDRNRKILYMRFFAAASWPEIAYALEAASPDAVRVECTTQSLPALASALSQLS